jgi:UDP-N-acetylmuramate dehydrogenase
MFCIPLTATMMSLFDTFPQFVRCNVPLAMYTRLQLGGPAEFFAEPATMDDLVAVLKHCRLEKIHVHILGIGSNLLISEKGVAGVVVSLLNPAFGSIAVEGDRVNAGAGAKLGQVITQAVSQGLGGIETLIGIPGSVGGALCGNAGTNNGNLGQWIESVKVVDQSGNISTLSKNEITFGYRSSSLDDVIILSATFRLEKEEPLELAKRMQKHWIVRKTQQPAGELASAFAFKNPSTGTLAEHLVERAGLKGTRIGGAGISERNAGFIVVEPEGTADDVLRLIQLVQDEVCKLTEVRLEPALEIW